MMRLSCIAALSGSTSRNVTSTDGIGDEATRHFEVGYRIAPKAGATAPRGAALRHLSGRSSARHASRTGARYVEPR